MLIRNNNQIITLTPLNVASFSFYDKKLKTTRKFYSLHIASSEGGYARKQFIEVQYESPYIALLSREFKEIDDIFSTSHNKIQSNTLPVQERYLLSPKSNKATLINRLYRGVISNRGIRTKKEVYSFFGNLKEPMKKYIKQQGLSFIKVEDLIKILKHFTYLKEKE
ncbi:hypothetical protein LVD17_06365 [Fulvivirga ulvae]|uniref:hypothetical protein n=1 Tax=Fulvivirga ulvae TaxID=2904245 RepID=UPI001F2DEB02|nr:hypothetical protein [Fulvivirga ulvae]UII33445.1 hypothetical protein LVD17_06365 [Fulvivirga ulvae]